MGVNKLVKGIKNAGDFFIIFADKTDIKANPFNVAVDDVIKLLCFVCSLNNGMILVVGIPRVLSGVYQGTVRHGNYF